MRPMVPRMVSLDGDDFTTINIKIFFMRYNMFYGGVSLAARSQRLVLFAELGIYVANVFHSYRP